MVWLPCKMDRVKKVVKSKVAAKKWLCNGKNFNNNNLGEFCAQIYKNGRYQNFAIKLPSQPFLGHHFGSHNFFPMVHFAWGLHHFFS